MEIGAARKIIEVVGNWNELPGIAKSACTRLGIAHRKLILDAPAVDAVPRPVFEQIQWERDCAMQQLKDHDIPFGGIAPDVVKVVRCKNCRRCDGFPGEEIEPNEIGICRINRMAVKPDDYCSFGERRADDGK